MHQKVWETHAASWMSSGAFTDLIGLKVGTILLKKTAAVECLSKDRSAFGMIHPKD